MSLSLSKRAARTAQSEIRTMSVECEKVKGINLAQGVCDTEVPEIVRVGAQQAIDAGLNSYTRCDGIAELRQAVAEKMRNFNGIECDPETEVIISAGSTGSFYTACLALLNPGDEVILFEPYYGYHLHTLISIDAVPLFLTLQAPDWKFSAEALEQVVTPRTRGILINTPANPSGKIFTQHELESIAAFAQKHDLFVFTDEIYEYFLFEGRHISMATLPGMRSRTITMSGYSKTFSITGWRIGYTVCDSKWAQAISYFNDLVYVCAPAPLQRGVAEGIRKLPQDFYRQISEEYTHKRDLLCGTLEEIGLTPSIPKGAYYVLADASLLPGTTGKEKSRYLLREAGVAAVAGSAFFHSGGGDNLLRFCFAKTDAELTEACRRLKGLAEKIGTHAAASVSR
jgi:aminotransferase